MRKTVRTIALLVLAAAAGCRSASSSYEVAIGSTIVNVPMRDWKPLENSEPYAENFEARVLKAGHAFPQVLTVFKVPMSEDRRLGIRISDNEFLEFFVVHP